MLNQYLRILSGTGVSIGDPYKIWSYLAFGETGVSQVMQERFVQRLLGIPARETRRHMNELRSQKAFHQTLFKSKGSHYLGEIVHGPALYVLCRSLLPRVVIETGVASGVSSAYILKALDENNYGSLFSIDMPNYEEVLVRKDPGYLPAPVSIVPPGKEPGWAVPVEIRKRWTLEIGRSQERLPRLLSRVPEVNLFLHDSEHTYANMEWEFRTAWSYLSDGGVLLSDDVGWNRAYYDFCKAMGLDPFVLDGRLGATRKPRGS